MMARLAKSQGRKKGKSADWLDDDVPETASVDSGSKSKKKARRKGKNPLEPDVELPETAAAPPPSKASAPPTDQAPAKVALLYGGSNQRERRKESRTLSQPRPRWPAMCVASSSLHATSSSSTSQPQATHSGSVWCCGCRSFQIRRQASPRQLARKSNSRCAHSTLASAMAFMRFSCALIELLHSDLLFVDFSYFITLNSNQHQGGVNIALRHLRYFQAKLQLHILTHVENSDPKIAKSYLGPRGYGVTVGRSGRR
jgi:hypothetical protein